jgi:hypothetical protein
VENFNEFYRQDGRLNSSGRNKRVFSGKVDVSIEDPEVLNREWLHNPVTAKLNIMQIGEGRPRYTLMSMTDLIR